MIRAKNCSSLKNETKEGRKEKGKKRDRKREREEKRIEHYLYGARKCKKISTTQTKIIRHISIILPNIQKERRREEERERSRGKRERDRERERPGRRNGAATIRVSRMRPSAFRPCVVRRTCATATPGERRRAILRPAAATGVRPYEAGGTLLAKRRGAARWPSLSRATRSSRMRVSRPRLSRIEALRLSVSFSLHSHSFTPLSHRRDLDPRLDRRFRGSRLVKNESRSIVRRRPSVCIGSRESERIGPEC